MFSIISSVSSRVISRIMASEPVAIILLFLVNKGSPLHEKLQSASLPGVLIGQTATLTFRERSARRGWEVRPGPPPQASPPTLAPPGWGWTTRRVMSVANCVTLRKSRVERLLIIVRAACWGELWVSIEAGGSRVTAAADINPSGRLGVAAAVNLTDHYPPPHLPRRGPASLMRHQPLSWQLTIDRAVNEKKQKNKKVFVGSVQSSRLENDKTCSTFWHQLVNTITRGVMILIWKRRSIEIRFQSLKSKAGWTIKKTNLRLFCI